MLNLLLQVWGGLFYLLNKVFFSRAERSVTEARKRQWRIWSWVVFLVGLPAWATIFVLERNWIAAALEFGGVPSMFMGLVIAIKGKGKGPKWLERIALIAIVIGLTYSLYDFGGLTTINQFLELGIVAGFLIGTYLLARQEPTGYLWFIFMNLSCAALMGIQNYPWLMLQQIVSLGFVIDAYRMQKKRTI